MNQIIFFVASCALIWGLTHLPRTTSRSPVSNAKARTEPRPPPAVAGLVRFEPRAKSTAEASEEELRARTRDRYVAARFPGILSSAADLDDSDRVVNVARLLFEEDHYDDAQELLQIAIARSGSESLRLARLELTFLRRDASRYIDLARELRQAHPKTREWSEVARLGRLVAPGEPLFGSGGAERTDSHYGPWPDMPNWIQASWDFTPDALAAELHRDLKHEPGADRAREPKTSNGA
jgi:hypothetical protein